MSENITFFFTSLRQIVTFERLIFTWWVGLLPLHTHELLPLVFGSDPLVPQEPGEQSVRFSALPGFYVCFLLQLIFCKYLISSNSYGFNYYSRLHSQLSVGHLQCEVLLLFPISVLIIVISLAFVCGFPLDILVSSHSQKTIRWSDLIMWLWS